MSPIEREPTSEKIRKLLKRRDAMSEGVPIWTNDGKHELDIAKFVIEGDEFVEQIVSRAVNELRRTTRGKHLNFAGAVTEGSPDSLYAAVEALYLHLSDDYHLLYEFERAFDKVTGEQQIRLPLMTGRANRGTCIVGRPNRPIFLDRFLAYSQSL